MTNIPDCGAGKAKIERNREMDIFIQVIQNQWVFILLAVALVVLMYVIKAKKPENFKRFAMIELVATVAALVIFALFGFQDLFLLAPVILISCELFGYTITGKIVGVLLVDYLLIIGIDVLYKNGAINDLFDTILFYGLQIIAAVAIGIMLDNHIKMLNKEKKKRIEAEKEQEKLRDKKLNDHVDEVFSNYGTEHRDLTEDEIDKILNDHRRTAEDYDAEDYDVDKDYDLGDSDISHGRNDD